MAWYIIAAVAWIASGAVAWGMTLGYFTKRFPYMANVGVAGFMALAGPAGVLIALCEPPYSFRWRPLGTEVRWNIYHEQYPHTASRQSFIAAYGFGKEARAARWEQSCRETDSVGGLIARAIDKAR